MLLASWAGNLSELVSIERPDNADKDGDSRGRLSSACVRRHFLPLTEAMSMRLLVAFCHKTDLTLSQLMVCSLAYLYQSLLIAQFQCITGNGAPTNLTEFLKKNLKPQLSGSSHFEKAFAILL